MPANPSTQPEPKVKCPSCEEQDNPNALDHQEGQEQMQGACDDACGCDCHDDSPRLEDPRDTKTTPP